MKYLFRTLSLILIVAVFISLFAVALPTSAENNEQFATPILVVNTSFLNVRTGPSAGFPVLITVVGGTELPVLGVANDKVWYQVATDAGVGWVNVTFTLPRGDFTNVPLADITTVPASVANLGQGGGFNSVSAGFGSGVVGGQQIGATVLAGDFRANPGSNTAMLFPQFPGDPNTVYPILNQAVVEGRQWVQVNLSGVGAGWTDRFQLRPLQCGGESVVVFNRTAGVTPLGANSVAFTVNAGEEGFSMSSIGGQIQVLLANGGLVVAPLDALSGRSDSIVSVCSGVPVNNVGQGGGATDPNANLGQGGGGFNAQAISGNRVVVNTGFLNIRSGPSAGFTVVATVPGGTELAVLGRAKDNVWLLIQGPFGQGWLNNQFTVFRGDYSTVPILDNDAAIAAVTQGINPNANLGQGGGFAPSASTGIVGGRVFGASILGGDFRLDPGSNTALIFAMLGADPSTVYPILNQAIVEGRTWVQLNVPGLGAGWTDQFQIRPLQCGAESVSVFNRTAGVTPIGTTGSSFTVNEGEEGFDLGSQAGQVRIQLANGGEVLAPLDAVSSRSSSIVSICNGIAITGGQGGGATDPNANLGQGGGGFNAQAISGNRVVVNTGFLNIRSGPSAGFTVVATVPGGTELAVLGRAKDNVWYLIQGAFGQGWINSEFTIFRGDYSTVPIVDF